MAAVAGNDAGLVGIIIIAVVIPMLGASAIAMYFSSLRPLRNKSLEEAVRYLRDHVPRKYQDDDLITFARRRTTSFASRKTTRVGKRSVPPPLLSGTALSALYIVFAMVRIAMGDTNYLLFFGIGIAVVGGCAFLWFFEYVIRTQNAVCIRYLDEAD